jgi:glycosyltransferase involved in cell wall biosynthesis
VTFRVSVCIPAYKQPELLLRTVKSVLMQKNCDFEIVITDDSGDDSVEVALGELIADRRIHYMRNSLRLGAIGNWNASIENARTDIIKILHHDDWFDTDDALSRIIEPIASGETLVVFTACRAMSVHGGEMFMHRASPEQLEMLKDNLTNLVFANFIGAPSVAAFSRKMFVPFNPAYTWLSDVDFYIRLIEKAEGQFKYLCEPLINITSDSKEQLSRECEAQRLRSLKENISLVAECGTKRRQQKLAPHFFSLAYGLTASEIFVAISFALRLGEFRIARALVKGLVFAMISKK